VAPGASAGQITTDNDAAFATLPAYSNCTLSWKFKDDAATGTAIHVTVPVENATNYNDYQLDITLTALDKDAQNLSFAELSKTAKYGDSYTLAATASVSNGGQITYSTDPANSDIITLDAATGAVTALKTGDVTIIATAAETENYAPATASYTLTVTKRAVTVTAKNYTVNVGGSLPAKTALYEISGDGFLEADGLTVEVFYMDGDHSIEDSEVDLTTPGAYGIMVYVDVSSKLDFYDVTTSDNATLTVSVPAPAQPVYDDTPSSSTTTSTDSEGNTTTTTTSADGSTTAVVTDKDGNLSSAEATVSQAAANAAGDEPVSLEMEDVEAADTAEEAPQITVTVPASAGEVDVEIPVEDVKPGTVVYKVNEDGSMEIVKDCTVTEDGVVVSIEGTETLVVVDNSKEFTDVEDDSWAAEAIEFVTAREIFEGTGTDTFSPKQNVSRGMIAQVLFNFDKDAEASDGESSFNDLNTSRYYADAVEWAAAEGIVNGYADGSFKGEEDITREQLVTILYRYAKLQGKGLTGLYATQLDFEDAGDVSDYASEAMQWAVINGIINGKNGLLDPQGPATREQLAAIMQRYINLK
jgi:hypothetical protein